MQVNFTQKKGGKSHFDHMFVYSSAHSCCVRDVFQAMKRVRQFGSPDLYYCCDTPTNLKQRRSLCTSLEAVGRHIKHMGCVQEHYCGHKSFALRKVFWIKCLHLTQKTMQQLHSS